MNEQFAWFTFLAAISTAAIRSGTPIAFAAIGETICERAGIINLGLEGIMLVGALVAVVVRVNGGHWVVAVLAAGLAAAMLAALHALFVIGLDSNQIVSGIALSILGTGLTGFLGRPYVGVRVEGITATGIAYLKDVPFFGPIFFQHDPLVYLAVVVALGAWFLLVRTRFGLYVRAVGEDPEAAYAQGVPVRKTRVMAVLFGGFLAGIGGAHLSLAYTQLWAERMTSGQGIIAVGLVIVSAWRPLGALFASYMFGVLTVLHPNLQASGITASPYLVKMLPYVLTIAALTAATFRYQKRSRGLPTALMKQFLSGRT
jgi:general nucleoside transport system permease protein